MIQFPSFNQGRKKLTLVSNKKENIQKIPSKSPELVDLRILKRENMRMRGKKGKDYPIIMNDFMFIKEVNKGNRAFSEISKNTLYSNHTQNKIRDKKTLPLSILGSRVEEKEQKERKETAYSINNKKYAANLAPIRKGKSFDVKKRRRSTHKKSIFSVSPWKGQTEQLNEDLIF